MAKSVTTIDAEITAAEVRVAETRARAVEQIAAAAERAGLLDVKLDDAAYTAIFAAITANLTDAEPSIFARRRKRLNLLHLNRASAAKRARKQDDRAKFIIGGYLLAQFKRNPEMASELTPLISDYVDQQRSASLREADKALVSAMIDKNVGGAQNGIAMPPNKMNRATIIIGAWLIDAASKKAALAEAHGPGIRAFVNAGDTAKGREADRAVVDAVWKTMSGGETIDVT